MKEETKYIVFSDSFWHDDRKYDCRAEVHPHNLICWIGDVQDAYGIPYTEAMRLVRGRIRVQMKKHAGIPSNALTFAEWDEQMHVKYGALLRACGR